MNIDDSYTDISRLIKFKEDKHSWNY